MNGADLIILATLCLSILTSLLDGFTKTVLSLFAWILAFSIALKFFDKLANLFIQYIPFIDLRLGLSLVALFAIALAMISWLNYLIIRSIELAMLSSMDRFLGALFGLMRGTVAVIFLVLLTGLSKLPTTDIWQQSTYIVHFQKVAVFLCMQLPMETAIYFNFKSIPITST